MADPICTYLFSIIVLTTTLPVVKECTNVLLEGTPNHLSISEIEQSLKKLDGVVAIHDLHVWAISINKFSLSAHIISAHPEKTLTRANKLLRRKYDLYHTTIQVESIEHAQSNKL